MAFCALLMNCLVGALAATAVGVAPLCGVVALSGISLFKVAPSGTARAGIYTEVWTGHMTKAFRNPPESLGWYNRIRSFDQYVNNDVIHFINIGGDPTVLINNTTYPIGIETLEDADKAISLDKYQTKATQITDDELYAISYDKMATVIERHKEAISEKKYSRALHAISPQSNTDATPVILTKGNLEDGRRMLTRASIIALKKKFDDAKVPLTERILVLCPDHVADLLETDQKFAGQYYKYETGKICNMFGFEIYEYTECPLFDSLALTKLPYGSIADANSHQASIAYAASRMMKANGSTKAYLKEAKNNPETQASLANFRHHSICLPLKMEAMGAIVSAVS